jgi:hypothetical protein
MSNLDKAARNALPDEHFAVPGKRKLPINDQTHVKLAWDMVERTQGISDEERAAARTRIRNRAKELGVDTAHWSLKASISFEAMALNVPAVFDHPNRMPFSGVLTRVDEPSDEPPGGAQGKRIYISTKVAESALPSLLGMAVDYVPGFAGHDRKNKIGIITSAVIEGSAVKIEGFFYAKDFPEECRQIKAEKGALGFSYECDVRILDLDADPWVVEYCVFTGAAVLYKDLAAYRTTSLAANADKGNEMSKEEMQAMLDAMIKPLSVAIEAQSKEIATIKAAGASLGGPIIDQVRPHVDACMACADAMEAAGVGSHPAMGHAAAIRKIGRHMAVEAATGKVPHIYNDHSYFDGGMEASTAKAAKDAADKLAADKVESDKKIAELTAATAAIETKMKDLQAAAFNQAKAAERATLPANVLSLLAKADIKTEDMKDGKLSVDQVNAMLDAGKINGPKATEIKLKLRNDGLMQVGTR